ncbi:hypothetical protein HHL16_13215 [Pseudoflavitalea sp. G-6-1-2]|uniref:hypothetical protein n=1 Tax=Pseudoflavitalea sp. G-6-1-2 TaxID=2728841 RepID=UPI00146B8823|nr:hypothetical protein [Pseudoflavitalea sp. G-6-1-2]NML21844.1 hypothetical protein [Pseudoflavitalea sp. G-6-1-2]
MKNFVFLTFLCLTITVSAQVNLPTGSAEVNIPLFKNTDERNRLSVDISMNYVYGNGVRLNEYASNVGAGWSLNAGGVISRVQYGEPDDQSTSNEHGRNDMLIVGKIANEFFPEGYMYSPMSPTNLPPAVGSYVPTLPSGTWQDYKLNIDDREQDRYLFQFGGRTGQFIIGKNKEVKIIGDAKLNVSFVETNMLQQNVRTKISSFTIRDEQGIEYKFDQLELSTVFEYRKTSNLQMLSNLTAKRNPVNYRDKIVTKWFLSEIKNPLTQKKVSFTYEPYTITAEGPRQVTAQTVYIGNTPKKSMQFLKTTIESRTQRLKRIDMPDNKSVTFDYGIQRADLPGEYALHVIKIFQGYKLLSGYNFSYEYMSRTELWPLNRQFNEWEWRWTRLCLKQIQKFGSSNGTIPPYRFSYNIPYNSTVVNLPPTMTFQTDHFGYWGTLITDVFETNNGTASYINGQIFTEKVIHPKDDQLMPSLGMLNKVTYPEGGSITYEYELNQAEASTYSSKYSGGVRVKRTTIYDGEDHAKDIVKEYRYTNTDGTSSAFGYEKPIYGESKVFRQYKHSKDGGYGENAKEFTTSLAINLLMSRAQAMSAGTLGGAMFNVTMGGTIEMVIVYIVLRILDEILGDNFHDYDVAMVHLDNLNLGNPLPQMYSRVEVVDIVQSGTSPVTNGKVVYEFTSDQEYPFRSGGPMTAPYSMGKQRYAPWLYGNMKTATWYNASGKKVKNITNEYNSIAYEYLDANFASRAWVPNRYIIGFYLRAYDETEDQFITSEVYYPLLGRMELKNSTVTLFNSLEQPVQSNTTNYTYNQGNYLVQTVAVADSKGDISGSTTYYSSDYNVSGVINDMKLNNILQVPLSVNIWKQNAADGERKLISSTVTEFGRIPNGDFQPVKTFQSELTIPLENSIASTIKFSTSNLTGYDYLKPSSTHIYDGSGHMTEVVTNFGGARKCRLYDYNGLEVVAECINATTSDIRYTSFEADGKGGWEYDPQSILYDEPGPTGTRVYNLTFGTVNTKIATGNRKFILSFWSKGGPVTVNAPTPKSPVRTSVPISGWTYYEYELENITLQDNIGLSGNVMLDELRLYPANSILSTSTWLPGIGKESECDVNGRITYYEYDEFGRLKKIMDQNRNLLKAFEYNYKN